MTTAHRTRTTQIIEGARLAGAHPAEFAPPERRAPFPRRAGYVGTLTVEEAILILRAFVAECWTCGGCGRVPRTHRQRLKLRRTPAGRLRGKTMRCPRCKKQQQIAEVLMGVAP